MGCLPLEINGTLPKMWDWLSTAIDGGKADYMNSVVEVWAGKDAVSIDINTCNFTSTLMSVT